MNKTIAFLLAALFILSLAPCAYAAPKTPEWLKRFAPSKPQPIFATDDIVIFAFYKLGMWSLVASKNGTTVTERLTLWIVTREPQRVAVKFFNTTLFVRDVWFAWNCSINLQVNKVNYITIIYKGGKEKVTLAFKSIPEKKKKEEEIILTFKEYMERLRLTRLETWLTTSVFIGFAVALSVVEKKRAMLVSTLNGLNLIVALGMLLAAYTVANYQSAPQLAWLYWISALVAIGIVYPHVSGGYRLWLMKPELSNRNIDCEKIVVYTDNQGYLRYAEQSFIAGLKRLLGKYTDPLIVDYVTRQPLSLSSAMWRINKKEPLLLVSDAEIRTIYIEEPKSLKETIKELGGEGESEPSE